MPVSPPSASVAEIAPDDAAADDAETDANECDFERFWFGFGCCCCLAAAVDDERSDSKSCISSGDRSDDGGDVFGDDELSSLWSPSPLCTRVLPLPMPLLL